MVVRKPGLGLTGVEQTNFRIQQSRQAGAQSGTTNTPEDPNGRRTPPAQQTPLNNGSVQPTTETFITNLDMSQVKSDFGQLALTNYYQVNISGLTPKLTYHLSQYYNVDYGYVTQNIGILCSDANLPTSTFATAEVKDNYIGITQEFAHTRLYTDVDFTFYVDNNYNVLRFFEGWMDFISGTSETSQDSRENISNSNYYRRMNYPKDYKINGLYIVKFERDTLSTSKDFTKFKYRLKYKFINAFPKSITSIPVSYGPADLLKVTVTMNYDRYIVSRDDNTSVRFSDRQNREQEQIRNQILNQAEPPQTNRPREQVNAQQPAVPGLTVGQQITRRRQGLY